MAQAIEPCRFCAVTDALGRHAWDCPHAIEIGLPRLSDGEEPIDPEEVSPQDLPEDRSMQGTEALPFMDEDEIEQRHRSRPRVSRHVPPVSELWMAWKPSEHDDPFDAVIFDTEIDALRFAVKNSYRVSRLELGKPLREQTEEK